MKDGIIADEEYIIFHRGWYVLGCTNQMRFYFAVIDYTADRELKRHKNKIDGEHSLK